MARRAAKRNYLTQMWGIERGVVGHDGGDRLEEHSASGPITLGVRQGSVRFTAAGEAVEAGEGTVLACVAGVPHSVEALSDAVCLLHVVIGGEGQGLG